MRMTAECNPYGTMLDLLLLEAEEMQSDQILMISRSEKTNLYFVSGNRVQKAVQLQVDCTPDLVNHIQKMHASVKNRPDSNQVQVKLAQNQTGRCVSLIIQKAAQSQQNVDATIKIPPIDLA